METKTAEEVLNNVLRYAMETGDKDLWNILMENSCINKYKFNKIKKPRTLNKKKNDTICL